VERVDFEVEEFLVAESVVLALHGFDFVVGAFEGSGGDGMIVPGEDALGVGQESAGELLDDADAGSQGLQIPRLEEPAGLGFAGLVPQLSQIFLEIVGGGQRLIQLQGLPPGVLARCVLDRGDRGVSAAASVFP